MTPLKEEWLQIPEFSSYSVSTKGVVQNDNTGYVLTPNVNQRGAVYVALWRDSEQHNRAINRLVSEAFIPIPSEAYDTPINLNGDRKFNAVTNLMWRPRWFAVRYAQQFVNGKRGLRHPIEDVETGEHYITSWQAAIRHGLLDRDIMLAVLNNEPVWPTGQRFRLLDPTYIIPRQYRGI